MMESDYTENSDEDCSEKGNVKQNKSSEDLTTSQTNSCKTESSQTNLTELKKNQKIAYFPKNSAEQKETTIL